MKYCEDCGYKNEANARFCENCGKGIQSVEGNSDVALKKKRSGKKIVLILLSVVLIFSMFVIGIKWYFREDSTVSLFSFIEKARLGNDDKKMDQKNINKGKTALRMQISQIDNSAFPKMTLYTQIRDRNGEQVEKIDKKVFAIKEIGPDGKEQELLVNEILPIEESSEMNINLVLDQSGSMDEDDKIINAQNAAYEFVDEILNKKNNFVEITAFDSYVHNLQAFTSNKQKVEEAIESIELGDQTALYDALYDALIQTNQKTGSRFVIAFTDGDENASLHSENEVIELSKQTGIPVYIIGIGSSVDTNYLEAFTASCNGDYYSAEVENLSNVLLDIYEDIYGQQQDMYKIVYTSKSENKLDQYHKVIVSPTESSSFSGKTQLEYMPKDKIAGIDNSKILEIIEKNTDVENVAVAIVDLVTNMEFRVGNARQTYVASGFYAPIYTVASSMDQKSADQMMKTMDNEAGNSLIDEYGGLSDVTEALSNQGYTQTIFNRKFGDVAASEAGYENYTSAVDSAKILRDIYANNGYKNMNWDLTKDGITLPKNAKVYAHRGQGIGGAYNIFAIIEEDETKYGVAVMSAHTGTNNEAQGISVPMISDILLEVHRGMTGY